MRWPERARRRWPGRLATVCWVTVAMLAALLGIPAVVIAASPGATQPPAGDPRSSGQGPGLVGDPLTAVVVVAAIAVLTIAVTMLYVRATDERDPSEPG